jgi:hypothetical protein
MNGARRLILATLGTLCMSVGASLFAAAPALAVAPEAPETISATGVTNTSAELQGILNPLAPATDGWFFDYNQGPSCTGTGARSTPLEAEIEEALAQPVSAEVTGLVPHTQYTFCAVARNVAEETTLGSPISLTTSEAAPFVAGESFSDVGSSSASVDAEVNPLGSPTRYFFEYGPNTSYGSRTSTVDLGDAIGNVATAATLEGLRPETAYHARVVAESEFGTSRGNDFTFVTFPGGALVLPDSRVDEMVTPPDNLNSDVDILASEGPELQDNGLPFEASTDGNAVAYAADPAATGNGAIGVGQGNEYLATSSPGGGWSTEDIQPEGYFSPTYSAFSPDLSVSIMSSSRGPKEASLPPLALNEASESKYGVIYSHPTNDGSYDPFFTKVPPNRPASAGFDTFRSMFAGGNAGGGAVSSFNDLLFEANDSLLEGEGTLERELDKIARSEMEELKTLLEEETTPQKETERQGHNSQYLYDFAAGKNYLVSVLPDGSADLNASFGRGHETELDFDNVISDDGSRIFWSAMEISSENPGGAFYRPKALYVRENATAPESPLNGQGGCTTASDACTVQIDASEGLGAGGGGQYWTSGDDGSKVFFTDCSRLTVDATAVSTAGPCFTPANSIENRPGPATYTGNDLYEYDLNAAPGHRLTDLSVDGHGSDALGADVQGVVGAGEDGSYVYFVATGILTDGKNSEEREPVPGADNLYVTHFDGVSRVTTFIQTLSSSDSAASGDHGSGDWRPELGDRTSRVTPDGHAVVFMSGESLTGYNNLGASEVYTYDADTARLSCVSCDPTGEPPPPSSSPNASGGVAAYLPPSLSPTYLPRWMSDDGSRVFFDSVEPLVAQDTNGMQDVYEWEREGAGSCTVKSPPRSSGGCISLLSGGSSTDDSFLVDASASGDDVFINTRAQLASQDRNENRNLFDVRTNGVVALSPPACTGSGCQGIPPAPPIFATPSSVTFNGVGNFSGAATRAKPVLKSLTRAQKLVKALKACKAKSSKRKRVACEARARKRYGAKIKLDKSAKGRK